MLSLFSTFLKNFVWFIISLSVNLLITSDLSNSELLHPIKKMNITLTISKKYDVVQFLINYQVNTLLFIELFYLVIYYQKYLLKLSRYF